jgi:copper chaperone CopZ
MNTLSKPLFLFILFFSTQLHAGEYLYNADVKGMVCAFCAYNVSKNISKLPGVEADSVDVDLKGGHVQFHSTQVVDENNLVALFNDSGFSISNLKQSPLATTKEKLQPTAALIVEVEQAKTEQYSNIFESIGNIAASTPSHLLITAPADYEDKLLKPILMGRQQVIKVRFIANQSDTIRIQLFADK